MSRKFARLHAELCLGHVRKLETRVQEGYQPGFNLHPEMMSLEGKQPRARSSSKTSTVMRDVEFIRERWVWWFYTLLNTKSTKLDPDIARDLDRWPLNTPLGVQPTVQDFTNVIRSLANGKRYGIPVELFNIASTSISLCDKECLTSSSAFGEGERLRNSGKMPPSRCLTGRIGQSVATIG